MFLLPNKIQNKNRGPEEDRTPDLRNANAALSQLSYRPISKIKTGNNAQNEAVLYTIFQDCLQDIKRLRLIYFIKNFMVKTYQQRKFFSRSNKPVKKPTCRPGRHNPLIPCRKDIHGTRDRHRLSAIQISDRVKNRSDQPGRNPAFDKRILRISP